MSARGRLRLTQRSRGRVVQRGARDGPKRREALFADTAKQVTISQENASTLDRAPAGVVLDEPERAGAVLLLAGGVRLSQPLRSSELESGIVQYSGSEALSLQRAEQHFAHTLTLIRSTVRAFQEQELTGVAEVQEAATGILRALCEDADVTVAAAFDLEAGKQAFNERLLRQSVRTAVLSVAVGLEMALPLESLLHLGTAGLTCDLSLFHRGSPDEPAGAPTREADHARIVAHPQQTFDALAKLRNVPGPVLLSILHHHEPVEGGGCAYRLSPGKALPLPWILSLVQAYLELTEPLYGGRGYLPADSVAYLMHHTLRGQFDIAATRALLRVVSAYPIGSMVKLSDQSVGKVVGRATGDAMHPVVRIGEQTRDLGHTQLNVVEPIENEEQPQQRLPVSRFDERLWLLDA